jgi:hypothetical protein
MSMIKENPVLFGCLAMLGLASLIACSGVVATYFLADQIVEKATEKMEEFGAEAGKQTGLKEPFKSVPELLGKGWSVSIQVQNEGEVQFAMISQQARTVDCQILQSVLFPYLSGTKETVVVTSENRSVSEDGTVTATPVECRWSGYPGASVPPPSGGEASSGGTVVPAGQPAPEAPAGQPAAAPEPATVK